MLTKVKNTLPPGKQSNVVYRIPCSCSQVYIGETKRRLETRLKEHRDACERGMMEKSAVAEHVWEHHHPIHWEETTMLDRGRGQELLVKKALHIQMTPVEECFNRDGGLEVPGCWTTVMRRQGGAILTDLWPPMTCTLLRALRPSKYHRFHWPTILTYLEYVNCNDAYKTDHRNNTKSKPIRKPWISPIF